MSHLCVNQTQIEPSCKSTSWCGFDFETTSYVRQRRKCNQQAFGTVVVVLVVVVVVVVLVVVVVMVMVIILVILGLMPRHECWQSLTEPGRGQ